MQVGQGLVLHETLREKSGPINSYPVVVQQNLSQEELVVDTL
jgi:hypothetical protein